MLPLSRLPPRTSRFRNGYTGRARSQHAIDDDRRRTRFCYDIPSGAQCDVVMKGGITSGVIYPSALHTLGTTYRIRGIRGTSAGAIGAAVGAAAEFARASGGFARLLDLPDQLSEGRLRALFQPERSTKALLPVMLAATGGDRPGASRRGFTKVFAVLAALVRSFPVAGVLGVLPGLALVVVGVASGRWAGWLLPGLA